MGSKVMAYAISAAKFSDESLNSAKTRFHLFNRGSRLADTQAMRCSKIPLSLICFVLAAPSLFFALTPTLFRYKSHICISNIGTPFPFVPRFRQSSSVAV
jgi:hypothetical protein